MQKEYRHLIAMVTFFMQLLTFKELPLLSPVREDGPKPFGWMLPLVSSTKK